MRLTNKQIVASLEAIKYLVPADYAYKTNSKVMGCYYTTPEKYSDGRRKHCIVGLVLKMNCITLPEVESPYNSFLVSEVAPILKLRITALGITMLREAQNAQDHGKTWHKAIDAALACK